MSIATPPPPVQQKKSGMGCFGCGCVILVAIGLLFLGLIVGGFYVAYKALEQATSTTAVDLPVYKGTDDFARITMLKVADFSHDVRNHQAATIHLNADEINAQIANHPEFAQKGIRIRASMTGSEGRLQGSIPTKSIAQLDGLLAGRYVNFDVSFQVVFDPGTKMIVFKFDTIQIGSETLLGEGAETKDYSKMVAQVFEPAFNQSFNEEVRQGDVGAALLDQMKSLDIENGELVIKTQ